MLKNMNAATLHLLKKLIADACTDERREELGQSKGLFTVKETVTLNVEGEVKVETSCSDAIIAQKAKPWDLFAVTLDLANKQLIAAGHQGIDLKRVVELAEKADSDLVKKAKAETKKAIAEVKEEVRGFRWGRVLVKGSVEKQTGAKGATDLFALPPKGDEDKAGDA